MFSIRLYNDNKKKIVQRILNFLILKIEIAAAALGASTFGGIKRSHLSDWGYIKSDDDDDDDDERRRRRHLHCGQWPRYVKSQESRT